MAITTPTTALGSHTSLARFSRYWRHSRLGNGAIRPNTEYHVILSRKVQIMTAKTLTTDELVAEMQRLTKTAGNNLVKFATNAVNLYAVKPWQASTPPVAIGDYFKNTFGVGPADGGFIALPATALDVLVKGLGSDVSYDDTMAMSGVGRATVARARKRCEITDPAKSEAIKASGTAGNADNRRTGEAQKAAVEAAAKLRAQNAATSVNQPEAKTPVKFTKTNVTPPVPAPSKPVETAPSKPVETAPVTVEFDLVTALSALDDAELTDVVSSVGMERLEILVANLSAVLADALVSA
jgi:hypothetical protein